MKAYIGVNIKLFCPNCTKTYAKLYDAVMCQRNVHGNDSALSEIIDFIADANRLQRITERDTGRLFLVSKDT